MVIARLQENNANMVNLKGTAILNSFNLLPVIFKSQYNTQLMQTTLNQMTGN